MIRFLKKRLVSFKNAFTGWWHVIRTQQNAWIHAVATVLIVILCIWLKIDLKDWALIIIAIAIVWLAEFLNTALEIVVDLASPDIHLLARMGKDVGAAAVLIAALTAALIGGLVLGKTFLFKIREIVTIIKK